MPPGQLPAFPLLDGEAESGAADAAHWSDVYEQLVNFCRSVLAEHDVVDNVDREALRRRLRHFEQRRDYWEQERRFAGGGGRSAQQPAITIAGPGRSRPSRFQSGR